MMKYSPAGLAAQRHISAQVVEGGGDYVRTIKKNQPRLREDIAPSSPATEHWEMEERRRRSTKGMGISGNAA